MHTHKHTHIYIHTIIIPLYFIVLHAHKYIYTLYIYVCVSVIDFYVYRFHLSAPKLASTSQAPSRERPFCPRVCPCLPLGPEQLSSQIHRNPKISKVNGIAKIYRKPLFQQQLQGFLVSISPSINSTTGKKQHI